MGVPPHWEEIPLSTEPASIRQPPVAPPPPQRTTSFSVPPLSEFLEQTGKGHCSQPHSPASKFSPTQASEKKGLPFHPRHSKVAPAPSSSADAPPSHVLTLGDPPPPPYPGQFSPSLFPGLAMEDPPEGPKAGETLLGYRAKRAQAACCKCDTLTVTGWLVVVFTAVLFCPLAFLVCLVPACHKVVQQPVYGLRSGEPLPNEPKYSELRRGRRPHS